MSSWWTETKRRTRRLYDRARGYPANHATEVSRNLIADSKYGNLPTIRRYLADPEVNVTMRNAGGKNALMNAARDGHIEVVRELIRLPAVRENINVGDIRGNTALMKAARNGHKEIVNILLANGADSNLQNHEGMNALMFALDIPTRFGIASWELPESKKDIANKLLERQNILINEQNNKDKTALMLAAENRAFEAFRNLIQRGADVTLQDTDGMNVLMLLAFSRASSITDYLNLFDGRGVYLNALNKYGQSALTLGILSMNVDYVKFLTKRISNIEVWVGDAWDTLLIKMMNVMRSEDRAAIAKIQTIFQCVSDYRRAKQLGAQHYAVVADFLAQSNAERVVEQQQAREIEFARQAEAGRRAEAARQARAAPAPPQPARANNARLRAARERMIAQERERAAFMRHAEERARHNNYSNVNNADAAPAVFAPAPAPAPAPVPAPAPSRGRTERQVRINAPPPAARPVQRRPRSRSASRNRRFVGRSPGPNRNGANED